MAHDALVIGNGHCTVEGMTDTPQPPRKREDDPEGRLPENDDDSIPDTPPTEPPPIPIRDPRPEGTPPGPYIS